MGDSESHEIYKTNRLSYAIPMPYLPSTSDATKVRSSSPTEPYPEMNLSEPEQCSLQEVEQMNCLSPTRVNSKAVVRYAEMGLPVPLNMVAENTDLRKAPKNWLRKGTQTKGFVPSSHLQTGFSSFKLANDFVDCMPDVDVISDSENIKKLLKLPYSNNSISMIVHRVGKSLLIDDFDIHQYLLKRSATEWDWLRKYFAQTILHQIEDKDGAVVRKNCSNSALQERNLISKFLYRSLQHTEEDEAGPSIEALKDSLGSAALINDSVLKNIPPLPDPEIEKTIPHLGEAKEDGFARNFIWTFEDIRMLIGSNMPIFGDEDHPCVSLKLRDMKKPINVLTGMDYWLDNLMCQVPEVAMCYHIDGIVQKYELIKTEELPYMEGSKFSPKIVKNIAQNVLAFLKSKAAKEGHTYWLFKGKNDDIVKLYDLTSLSQKDSGIKPSNTADDMSGEGGGMETEPDNPFQTPVSLLLYRLARNIVDSRGRREDDAVAQALLKNCIQLLDHSKYPHIATSAHFLLSELYVPADTDPAKPYFPKTSSNSSVPDEDSDEQFDSDEDFESSVDIHTLCYPSKLYGFRSKDKCAPPISDDIEFRCTEALLHIDHGLKFITSLEARTQASSSAFRKERERVERENLKMSVPGQAIPMGYISSDVRIVQNKISEWEKSCDVKPTFSQLSNSDYLKFLLLKKALLVYITLAEISFDLKKFGRSLKCVKRALNCFSMVESIGGEIEAETCGGMISFALGVAGDCYLAFISAWGNLPLYLEQYNSAEAGEGGIAEEVEKYTDEIDRDWTIKPPKDIQEGLSLSARCYGRALGFPSLADEEMVSLNRRLGNVLNEEGVFFMNQATALVKNLSDEDTADVSTSTLCAAETLLERSREFLNQGIALFQKIDDNANIALLLSNSGRLWRIAGHIKSLTRERNKHEFGSAEKDEYKRALSEYQKALKTLGNRKMNPSVWDSVTYELCCTFFTVGTLFQDQAPLSSLSKEDAEKQVIEYFLKALMYCDIDTVSSRQDLYRRRAAEIHLRLASLYHHSYRSYDIEDTSFRKKKLKQLSENHYCKAAPLYLQQERFVYYIRCVLEKGALLEAQLDSLTSTGAKQKQFFLILSCLLETRPALKQMSSGSDSDTQTVPSSEKVEPSSTKSEDELEEEIYVTNTLLQRVQATLLSLYKLLMGKTPKKGKEPSPLVNKFKELYAESLKTKNIAFEILNLLNKIQEANP